MTPERWQQITDLFDAALERDATERSAYLAGVCAGDEALRREVESLLSAHQQAGSFIAAPALVSKDAILQPIADGSKNKVLTEGKLTGQLLGYYQVQEKLGEGGMGVVYKARDNRLGRSVAIKVLPQERVTDAERKRRFAQEAKAASALNHPNIVAIYDIGQAQGLDFIAMEYVDGRTLDQHIPPKGMQLNDALKLAVQVAGALAKAHSAGTVHRDLKPSNVMVTDEGQVKVLDFGLAKLIQEPKNPALAETATKSQTEEGVILGTISYMSPEQAEGRKLDARSDIFSFGSVLYEMVAGQKAFQGDSKVSVLAAILNKEPRAVSEIRLDVHPDVERIIHRCLRKEPVRRFQTMADVRVSLQELEDELGSKSTQAAESTYPRTIRNAIAAGVVLLVAIAAGTAVWWWVRPSNMGPPETSPIPLTLTTYPGWESYPSFSPDGNQVAFAWWKAGLDQDADIYVKQIGVEEPYRLTDIPALEVNPAWSPDGRSIAFARYLSTDRVAYIVKPQRGGPERAVAEFYLSSSEIDDLRSKCTWTPDGKWLVVVGQNVLGEGAALVAISLETGERRKLTNAPARFVDTDPAISTDGRRMLFSRGLKREPRADLYRLKLSEGLIPEAEPEKLAMDNPWNESPAWSRDGKEIVFISGNLYGLLSLWRMAVLGPVRPQRLAFAGEHVESLSLSGSSHRLAYSVAREGFHIWKAEVSGGRLQQAALIASTRDEMEPAYSPDGRRIAFMSKRSGSTEIWVCEGDGSHPVQLTSFNGAATNRPRWSPDGQLITFYSDSKGNRDVYVIRSDGGAPKPLTTKPSTDGNPNWSADGKWIYFNSDRSGQLEIWKVPVGGGEAIPVHHIRGGQAVESPDGKFLYHDAGGPDSYTFWRVPTGGGKETLVVDSLRPAAGQVVVNEGIYFISKPDERRVSYIRFKDFATGSIRNIVPIEGAVDWGLSVSPDRQSFLYTHVDEGGSDLMLVENFD